MVSARTKSVNPIIIDNTSQRSALLVGLERLIMVVLTAMLWVYLITLIVYNFTNSENTIHYLEVALVLTISVVVILAVFIFWQFYNLFKFRNKLRRKSYNEDPDDALGRRYGMSGDDVRHIASSGQMVRVHYEDGHYDYLLSDGSEIEIESLREAA